MAAACAGQSLFSSLFLFGALEATRSEGRSPRANTNLMYSFLFLVLFCPAFRQPAGVVFWSVQTLLTLPVVRRLAGRGESHAARLLSPASPGLSEEQ